MFHKSEVKSAFIQWFDNASVLTSLHPSRIWDEKMSDPQAGIAIADSKKVRKICEHTEEQITANYTDLLDFYIRDAFHKINRNDIANPCGFSDIESASTELKNFFQCRELFKKFISDDIAVHPHKKSQVSAFVRWVSIASLLLKRHNYDAFNLVLTRLSQVETELHLEKNLPEHLDKKLYSLKKFILPSNNFKAMRDYIKAHHSKNDLPPTIIMSKDMTSLNEALGEDKNLHSKDIDEKHRSYEKIVRKERILDQLFDEKQQTTTKRQCSLHQEAIFHRIKEDYFQQMEQTEEDNRPLMSCKSRAKDESATAGLLYPSFFRSPEYSIQETNDNNTLFISNCSR